MASFASSKPNGSGSTPSLSHKHFSRVSVLSVEGSEVPGFEIGRIWLELLHRFTSSVRPPPGPSITASCVWGTNREREREIEREREGLGFVGWGRARAGASQTRRERETEKERERERERERESERERERESERARERARERERERKKMIARSLLVTAVAQKHRADSQAALLGFRV